jgi:putative oxidoreductase
MTAIDTISGYGRQLPRPRIADWVIRIPLAAVIIQQGLSKLPDFAAQAESFGLPLFAFALAAFAELAGGAAILLGGLMRNGIGDILTRLGGLAIAIVVTGVIVLIYFGPWIGWQFQSMLLAGGLFFLLRGNGR